MRSPNSASSASDSPLAGSSSSRIRGQVSRADLGERVERTLGKHPVVGVAARQPKQRRGEPGTGVDGRAGHNVLKHGEVAEQAHSLQGPRDSKRREPVRAQPVKRPAIEGQAARLRPDEAAQNVQQCCLARSVWPDHSRSLTGRDVKRYAIERG